MGGALVDLAQNGPEVLRPYLQQLAAELRAGVPFAEAVEGRAAATRAIDAGERDAH